MSLLLLGSGRKVSGGGGGGLVNSEATAFIARMSVTPDSTRQNLIDEFFTAIKANIGLAKFDAIYLFAATATQSSTLNLKSSSFTCSAVNSPTFTADRGWNGVSTNGRLDTGFNPATGGTAHLQNDSHVSGWSLTSTNNAGSIFGQASSTNMSLSPRYSGTDNNAYYRHHSATDDQNACTDGSGLWLSNRTGSAGYTVYRNGSSFAAETRVSAAPNSSNILFLDNSGEASWPGRVAAGSIGGGLTGGEITALYNAFLAYLQGVGAV